jgi:mannonate dehydratase
MGLAALPSWGANQGLSVPAENPSSQRMKVGSQRESYSRELLQYHKRHGVNHVVGWPSLGPDRRWTRAGVAQVIERSAAEGITVEMLSWPVVTTYRAQRIKSGDTTIPGEPSPVFSHVLRATGERDREIDLLCEMIVLAGEAGIDRLGYNLNPIPTLRSTRKHPVRGGSRATAWRLADGPDREDIVSDFGPLPAELFWERVAYFLERVLPVAEAAGVRLAHHPFDPPLPTSARYGGTACILGDVAGNKRFLALNDSPSHGLVFCCGTFAEGMADPHTELPAALRELGASGRIFHVHLRNIRGGFGDFVETFPDAGDFDCAEVIRILRDLGYTGMVIPDHMPRHPDDPGRFPRQAFAYGFGYLKALIQAAYAEQILST